MIDHFDQKPEAVHCITESVEKTSDHLIKFWMARHGCPIRPHSANDKAIVGELTKAFMKRSHAAQTHSTSYHPMSMLDKHESKQV